MNERIQREIDKAKADERIQAVGQFAVWVGEQERIVIAYPKSGFLGGAVLPLLGDRVIAKYAFDDGTWRITMFDDAVTIDMVENYENPSERDVWARAITRHYEKLGCDTPEGIAYRDTVIKAWTDMNGPLNAVHSEDE